MKHFLLIPFLLFSVAQAQSVEIKANVINSAGWYQKDAQLIVIHSIGEAVTQTFTNSPGGLIIKQGFLQPELSIHTGLEEKLQLSLTIFPNPAQQQLFIKGELSGQETLSLFDMTGKEWIHQKITSGGLVDVEHLPTGRYQILILNHKTGNWYVSKLEKR